MGLCSSTPPVTPKDVAYVREVLEAASDELAKLDSRVFNVAELEEVEPLQRDADLAKKKLDREWKLVHGKLAKEKLQEKDGVTKGLLGVGTSSNRDKVV